MELRCTLCGELVEFDRWANPIHAWRLYDSHVPELEDQ